MVQIREIISRETATQLDILRAALATRERLERECGGDQELASLVADIRRIREIAPPVSLSMIRRGSPSPRVLFQQTASRDIWF